MKYFILIFCLMFAGCSNWNHKGTIIKSGECVKVYNSQKELLLDSCDEFEKFKD